MGETCALLILGERMFQYLRSLTSTASPRAVDRARGVQRSLDPANDAYVAPSPRRTTSSLVRPVISDNSEAGLRSQETKADRSRPSQLPLILSGESEQRLLARVRPDQGPVKRLLGKQARLNLCGVGGASTLRSEEGVERALAQFPLRTSSRVSQAPPMALSQGRSISSNFRT